MEDPAGTSAERSHRVCLRAAPGTRSDVCGGSRRKRWTAREASAGRERVPPKQGMGQKMIALYWLCMKLSGARPGWGQLHTARCGATEAANPPPTVPAERESPESEPAAASVLTLAISPQGEASAGQTSSRGVQKVSGYRRSRGVQKVSGRTEGLGAYRRSRGVYRRSRGVQKASGYAEGVEAHRRPRVRRNGPARPRGGPGVQPRRAGGRRITEVVSRPGCVGRRAFGKAATELRTISYVEGRPTARRGAD